ncbi:mechanosensitive ion channel family protein [Chloroflexota bacterium]
MQPEFFSGSLFLEISWAVIILIIFILAAWLIRSGVRYIEHRLEKRTNKPILFPKLLESIIRSLFLLIIAEGLLLALGSLSYLTSWSDILGKSKIAIIIVLVTYALTQSAGEFLSWYLRSRVVRRKARVDEGLIRFMKRIMAIIIYAIGILVLLDYFSISITPIIAGLGIGGLAVALALQPTLANFFASTQIMSDRLVRTGDYIELNDGTVRGYVTDVGWRSTRIRTPFNNLVIIPNSRLADSILTNYYNPSMEMGVIINCGVSYNASLPRVEEIARAVTGEIIEELDEADKTFHPLFAFEEFGDSNINFWIWLRAKDRLASFKVKSEIIKRLKAALDKEGIMINYPARLLTFDDTTLPPAFRSGRQGSGDMEKKV